jgi:toxin ParE1/3/4
MIFDILLTSESEKDIDDSFFYYESQKNGLGLDFISQLQIAFTKISNSPNLYKKRYKNLRTIFLHRFPFTVYYKVEIAQKTCIIVAVLHFKRNPTILKTR